MINFSKESKKADEQQVNIKADKLRKKRKKHLN